MNKKGFTLIEILAVLVLIGIVGGLGYTIVTGISQSIKDEMLNKKAEIIEEAAILYGENIKGAINNGNKTYKGNKCESIQVKDLVPEYLDNDNDSNITRNVSKICKGISGNGRCYNESIKERMTIGECRVEAGFYKGGFCYYEIKSLSCPNNSELVGNVCKAPVLIVDPSNSDNYLDDNYVVLYLKNKRIHAKFTNITNSNDNPCKVGG